MRGSELPGIAGWGWPAGLFLVSFLVSSLHAVDLRLITDTYRQPGIRMALRYDQAAIGILDGEGILFPAKFPDPSDTGLLARPPGYAAFMAAVYAVFGRSYFALQLVQNLLNAISPVLIFLIAERLLGWRAAACGGLLAALSPYLAVTSNLVVANALCAPPLLLALLVLLRTRPQEGSAARLGLGTCLAAGALIGFAGWLRPNVMLLPPFAALVLLTIFGWKRRVLLGGAAMFLASVAVVSPITIRNWVVYHEFVPVSINGGLTLWQGVAEEGGTRFGARTQDPRSAQEEARYYGDPRYAAWWGSPDGIKRDRDRYRRAFAVIKDDPVWYARAMLGRMGRMVTYTADAFPVASVEGEEAAGIRPPVDEDESMVAEDRARRDPSRPGSPAADPRLRPRFSEEALLAPGRAVWWARPIVRALQWLTSVTMLPMILLGLAWVAARNWRTAAFLFLVPAYYLISSSPFAFDWRVMAPMHYGLFAFAGAAWVGLGEGAAAWFARQLDTARGRG